MLIPNFWVHLEQNKSVFFDSLRIKISGMSVVKEERGSCKLSRFLGACKVASNVAKTDAT